MTIMGRYILGAFLRNFFLALGACVILFLTFDFFERIDNIAPEGASLGTIATYFLLKVPNMVTLMVPVATLIGIIFSVGMLSKSSEITAMRASGCTLWTLTKPLYAAGLCISVSTLLINEFVTPACNRRVREIYNIDIQKKDQAGSYSQEDFWWRIGSTFYSADFFDSRSKSLLGLTRIEIDPAFDVIQRTDAEQTRYLDSLIGWSMANIVTYRFSKDRLVDTDKQRVAPLPLTKKPEEFYQAKVTEDQMSAREMRKFIKEQNQLGSNGDMYLPYLYEKFSAPLLPLILIPAIIPFSLRSARSGSLASSCLAGLVIAFSYYTIHSLSLSFGRAEMWPPLMAAWMANIILGTVGTLLSLGAESPA